jgi:hypothetical protein
MWQAGQDFCIQGNQSTYEQYFEAKRIWQEMTNLPEWFSCPPLTLSPTVLATADNNPCTLRNDFLNLRLNILNWCRENGTNYVDFLPQVPTSPAFVEEELCEDHCVWIQATKSLWKAAQQYCFPQTIAPDEFLQELRRLSDLPEWSSFCE